MRISDKKQYIYSPCRQRMALDECVYVRVLNHGITLLNLTIHAYMYTNGWQKAVVEKRLKSHICK